MNSLQLLYLKKLFGRVNPALTPRRKRKTAASWVKAALAGMDAIQRNQPYEAPLYPLCPLIEWAGTLLADAGSAMSPPRGQSEEDWGPGSFRSHAADRGGVGGQAMMALATTIMEQAPHPFGLLTREQQVEEIRLARIWAASHNRFILALMEAGKYSRVEAPQMRAECIAKVVEMMELVEELPTYMVDGKDLAILGWSEGRVKEFAVRHGGTFVDGEMETVTVSADALWDAPDLLAYLKEEREAFRFAGVVE